MAFLPGIDSPRYRYRRILVPALAWAVALGQDRFVDRAYFAVILFCIFLGTLWVAALARLCGRSAAWALGLIAVPAVAVSLDRMTVDAALIALIAGVSYYARKESWAAVFLALYVRWTGSRNRLAGPNRRGRVVVSLSAIFGAQAGWQLSVLPTLLWYLYVNVRAPASIEDRWSLVPFGGLITRLASPYRYHFGVGINFIATIP